MPGSPGQVLCCFWPRACSCRFTCAGVPQPRLCSNSDSTSLQACRNAVDPAVRQRARSTAQNVRQHGADGSNSSVTNKRRAPKFFHLSDQLVCHLQPAGVKSQPHRRGHGTVPQKATGALTVSERPAWCMAARNCPAPGAVGHERAACMHDLRIPGKWPRNHECLLKVD